MKKLISLILLFLSFLGVNAKTNIKVDDKVSPGDELVLSLQYDSNEAIYGYKFSLEYNSNELELINIKHRSFTGNNKLSNRDMVFQSNGETGKISIADLTFKVNSKLQAKNINVSLKGIVVCKKDGNKEIKHDLVFCEGGISNQEGGLEKIINLKSNNNKLSEISLNGVKSVLNFSPDILEYETGYPANIDSLKIGAVLADSNATFEDGFGSRTVDLEYGENVFEIKVKSQLGEVRVYTLKIIRKDDRKNDNYLKNIIIDDRPIENFFKEKLSYKVYAYKKDQIKIIPETSDTKAKAKVEGPEKLENGENVFKIRVSSEKEEELVYTVNVINIDYDFSKKLKSIYFKGFNKEINFDKNTTHYEVRYNKELLLSSYLSVVAEADKDLVSIKIDPDINDENEGKNFKNKLKPGDKITITVEGVDGKKEEYVILFKKDKRINIYFLLTLFLFILLSLFGFILYKKKKKNKEREDDQKTMEFIVDKKNENN